MLPLIPSEIVLAGLELLCGALTALAAVASYVLLWR
jgi:hypothetical protein